MHRKAIPIMIVLFLAFVAALVALGEHTAQADPLPCKANTIIGVGGYGQGGGGPLAGRADVIATYSGNLNDMEGGIASVGAAVNQVRSACPATTITLAGHSQGAAIVHVYLSRHGLSNGNAVLYADPKQAGTGQSDQLFWFGGPPVAGTDANFSGVPTVSLCNQDDPICNKNASWVGYFTGAHDRYNFDARVYAGKTGVIWQ